MTYAINKTRAIWLICLAVLGVGVAVATAPTAANASAYGYDYWGPHVIGNITVPSGQLFGAVEGEGVRVDEAGGNFVAAGNLCNWRIDVDFYDSNPDKRKRNYETRRGDTNTNCTRFGQKAYRFDGGFDARPGRICIRLYRDFGNERVASVCHAIRA